MPPMQRAAALIIDCSLKVLEKICQCKQHSNVHPIAYHACNDRELRMERSWSRSSIWYWVDLVSKSKGRIQDNYQVTAEEENWMWGNLRWRTVTVVSILSSWRRIPSHMPCVLFSRKWFKKSQVSRAEKYIIVNYQNHLIVRRGLTTEKGLSIASELVRRNS